MHLVNGRVCFRSIEFWSENVGSRMLSSFVPTLVVIVEYPKGLVVAIKCQNKALVASHEPDFVITQSEVFDLLSNSQFLQGHNLGAASTRNSEQFNVGVARLANVEVKQQLAVGGVSEVGTNHVSCDGCVELTDDVELSGRHSEPDGISALAAWVVEADQHLLSVA